MKPRFYLVIFIITGIVLRLGVVFMTKSHVSPELFEYEDVIKNLLSGRGFVYYNGKFQTDYYAAIHPLFTFLCAGIYLVTHRSFLAVEIFQILISVTTGYLTYKIGKEIYNEKTGLIAAALTIFHPGQIIYSTIKVMSPVLDAFFFVSAAYWILRTKRNPKIGNFILLGILIGLGSLVRGTSIICLPIAIIYYFLVLPLKKAQIFKKISVAFLFTLLVLSPWWIRNYLIFKQPVYMTTESMGYTLWVGFNEKATGTLYTREGKTQWEEAPGDLKERILGQRDEIAQQAVFRKEALNFIQKNPMRSLALYFKRILYFWWFTPTQGLFYPTIYFKIYKLFYIIYLVFFFYGFSCIFRDTTITKSSIFLLISIMFALSLLQGLYYVEGRHRWEVEPLLLLFTSYGLQNLLRKVLNEDY